MSDYLDMKEFLSSLTDDEFVAYFQEFSDTIVREKKGVYRVSEEGSEKLRPSSWRATLTQEILESREKNANFWIDACHHANTKTDKQRDFAQNVNRNKIALGALIVTATGFLFGLRFICNPARTPDAINDGAFHNWSNTVSSQPSIAILENKQSTNTQNLSWMERGVERERDFSMMTLSHRTLDSPAQILAWYKKLGDSAETNFNKLYRGKRIQLEWKKIDNLTFIADEVGIQIQDACFYVDISQSTTLEIGHEIVIEGDIDSVSKGTFGLRLVVRNCRVGMHSRVGN